jgi:uncharacterized protein (TIGR03118 family)
VFNSGLASHTFDSSLFIFATESGSIAAWSGGTNAVNAVAGATGSIYKGLGINTTGSVIYAANFGLNRIDVYDSNFHPVALPAGAFNDPTLPPGYAPFNVQNIGGQLIVTYAATNGGEDEIDGPHLGFIDVYDLNGVFQRRLVSQGPLNAPWGLALAPATGFGALSGALLVGNFGDGTINAFDPATGNPRGMLKESQGNPITIPGLWGLDFGNGSQGTSVDGLYFNAGIPTPGGSDIESHGLFGELTPTPVPEPGALALVSLGLVLAASLRRTSRRQP